VLPLIMDILLVTATLFTLIRLVGMETITRQRLESFHFSPEQMQVAMARSQSPAQLYITYASAAVAVPVSLLALAGILSIFAMVSSSQPRFGAMFSMVTLAFLPYYLITGAMTALVLLASPDRASLDITNLLATNPAAFIDKTTTSAGLYSLMTSLDVLSLGEIGMLAYGFSKVTKTSLSSALFALTALWVVYVSGKLAISLLF
jgi:hypothetical protein